MKNQNSVLTAAVLANGSDLVANIAIGVIGNEVANTFAGSQLTVAAIHNLSQVTFQAKTANYLGDR